MHTPTRRTFLQSSAASIASLSALTVAGAADKAGEKHIMAVIGVHGRGKDLLRGFSSFDDVEIAYICDPDNATIASALKAVDQRQKREPKVEKDLRRVFED